MYKMSQEEKALVESLYGDLYQVRFDLRDAKGSTLGLDVGKHLGQRYGVTCKYGDDDEVLKYAKKGCLLVSDSVLPETHVFEQAALTSIPMNYPSELDKWVAAEEEKAYEYAKKLPDGVHVGSLFSIGVADGMASYIVTKVNKKTCEIEWRGFGGGDRYTDHYFGWGRKVNILEVERYIRQYRSSAFLKPMFSR